MIKLQKRIIVVDDNASNLSIVRHLLKPVYEVYPAPSAYKLFEILKEFCPDLILLDINMPEINGFEAIFTLKQNPDYKDIPVIFLTARDDDASAEKGIDLGAIDYVTRPFSGPLLLRRISNILLMEQQKKELQECNKIINEINGRNLHE